MYGMMEKLEKQIINKIKDLIMNMLIKLTIRLLDHYMNVQ
jgi:hypothetical protein